MGCEFCQVLSELAYVDQSEILSLYEKHSASATPRRLLPVSSRAQLIHNSAHRYCV